MARFTILFTDNVKDDLLNIRAYDRQTLRQAIEMHLTHTPLVPTKKRKLLRNLAPPFEATPPIWQLRVGEFRVFYDVDEETRRVYVRAIRLKASHQHTEEIL